MKLLYVVLYVVASSWCAWMLVHHTFQAHPIPWVAVN